MSVTTKVQKMTNQHIVLCTEEFLLISIGISIANDIDEYVRRFSWLTGYDLHVTCAPRERFRFSTTNFAQFHPRTHTHAHKMDRSVN